MIYFYSSKIFNHQVSDFLFCLESVIKNNSNTIYVYLDLDDVNELNRRLIKRRLSLHHTIMLRPDRPIDKKGWIDEIEFLKKQYGDIYCCFILNHDHAFVNEKARERFEKFSHRFLSENKDGVFYYGHAAELACYLIFPPIGLYFKNLKDYNVYDGKVNWLDGYFCTRLSTIHHFMTLLKRSPDYLPRPDWPGAVYQSSQKKIGFCLEEFCYHLDGYDHFVNPSPIDYRDNADLIQSMLKMQLLHIDFALRKCCLFSRNIRALILGWMGKILIRRYRFKCDADKIKYLVNDILNNNYIVKSLSYQRIIYSFAPALFKKVFQTKIKL